LEPRILTNNIDYGNSTCFAEFVKDAGSWFGLDKACADGIVSAVAKETAQWLDIARRLRARPTEISRISSAFKHDDLEVVLSL